MMMYYLQASYNHLTPSLSQVHGQKICPNARLFTKQDLLFHSVYIQIVFQPMYFCNIKTVLSEYI